MKISGNVTRGLAVDFAEDSIYLKNKKVTETEDSRNRQYVQKQIVKYVEEGFEEAEIIEGEYIGYVPIIVSQYGRLIN